MFTIRHVDLQGYSLERFPAARDHAAAPVTSRSIEARRNDAELTNNITR
jgi:hypothetical protein